jgi:hypothetical protein
MCYLFDHVRNSEISLDFICKVNLLLIGHFLQTGHIGGHEC